MKVKLINNYRCFSEYQRKKPIFGQFETFEQIHLQFSAISRLAEKYSFGKLYLEIHHLLKYYVISMYHLDSIGMKNTTQNCWPYSSRCFLDRPNFWSGSGCRYLRKNCDFSRWLQFKQLHIYSLVKFLVILCKILDCRYQSLNMNGPVQSFQAKDVWTWIV